jgi:hypothetical protein
MSWDYFDNAIKNGVAYTPPAIPWLYKENTEVIFPGEAMRNRLGWSFALMNAIIVENNLYLLKVVPIKFSARRPANSPAEFIICDRAKLDFPYIRFGTLHEQDFPVEYKTPLYLKGIPFFIRKDVYRQLGVFLGFIFFCMNYSISHLVFYAEIVRESQNLSVRIHIDTEQPFEKHQLFAPGRADFGYITRELRTNDFIPCKIPIDNPYDHFAEYVNAFMNFGKLRTAFLSNSDKNVPNGPISDVEDIDIRHSIFSYSTFYVGNVANMSFVPNYVNGADTFETITFKDLIKNGEKKRIPIRLTNKNREKYNLYCLKAKYSTYRAFVITTSNTTPAFTRELEKFDEENANVVGFVAGILNVEYDLSDLEWVRISKKHAGQGWGSFLVYLWASYCADNGNNRIRLMDITPQSRKFYKKLGFTMETKGVRDPEMNKQYDLITRQVTCEQIIKTYLEDVPEYESNNKTILSRDDDADRFDAEYGDPFYLSDQEQPQDDGIEAARRLYMEKMKVVSLEDKLAKYPSLPESYRQPEVSQLENYKKIQSGDINQQNASLQLGVVTAADLAVKKSNEEEVARLRTEIEKLKTENSHLNDTIQKSSENLQPAEGAIQKENEYLKYQINTLAHQLKQYTDPTQMNVTAQQYQELQKKYNDLADAKNTATVSFQQYMIEQHNTIFELTKKLNELENTQPQVLMKEVEELKKENQKLKAANAPVSLEQVQSISTGNPAIDQLIQKLAIEKKQAEDKSAAYQRELIRIRRFAEQYEVFREENKRLKEQYSTNLTIQTNNANTITEYVKMIDERNKQIAKLEEDRATHEKQIGELKQQILQLTDKIQELKNQIEFASSMMSKKIA